MYFYSNIGHTFVYWHFAVVGSGDGEEDDQEKNSRPVHFEHNFSLFPIYTFIGNGVMNFDDL